MSEDGLSIEPKSVLDNYGYTKQQLDETGISREVLEIIYQTHVQSMLELKAVGDYIASRLSVLSDVHSLKVRVKDPEHLIKKIIRKKLEKPDLDITAENYRERVTDLVGIRALHLFKDQWQPIHEFVRGTWDLRETIAYIRRGDPDPIVERLKQSGCDVQEHEFGYRSVHYLICSQPAKHVHIAELQVRTLLEEAWSEIDHRVRYPRLSDNPYLVEFLNIFNRLAGSADEMGTFIKNLTVLIAREAEMESELKTKEEELKKAILHSEASEKQKKKLEAQVSELISLRAREITVDTRNPLSFYVADLTAPMSGLTQQSLSGGAPSLSAPIVSALVPRTRICSNCGRPYQDDSITVGSGGMVGGWCSECRSKLGRL